VHRLGHPFPARHLFGAVDARGPGIALAKGILTSIFVTLTSMH